MSSFQIWRNRGTQQWKNWLGPISGERDSGNLNSSSSCSALQSPLLEQGSKHLPKLTQCLYLIRFRNIKNIREAENQPCKFLQIKDNWGWSSERKWVGKEEERTHSDEVYGPVVVVAWMRMPPAPLGSGIWTFSPQLVMLLVAGCCSLAGGSTHLAGSLTPLRSAHRLVFSMEDVNTQLPAQDAMPWYNYELGCFETVKLK